MGLLLLGLLVRVAPVIRGRTLGIDTFYHLLAAKRIKEMRSLPKTLDSFAVHGTYAYPPALHIMLSKILGRVPERFLRTLPALFDVGNGVIVFAFSCVTIGPAAALVALAVYLFAPVCVSESLSLTPRTLGSFWLTCTMLSVITALDASYASFRIPLLAIASVFYALTLLTHKMATQMLVVALAAVGVFAGVAGYLEAPLAVFVVASVGFLLAYGLSGGHYIKVLREHLAYIRFHSRYGSLFKGGKSFGSLREIFGVQNPWLLLTIPVVMINWLTSRTLFLPELLAGERLRFVTLVLFVWLSSAIVMAVAWRYGDAERHTFYSVAPSALLLAILFESGLSYLQMILYCAALAYCAFIITIMIRRLSQPFVIPASLLECFSYLSTPPAKMIMTIPAAYAYAAAYFTNQKIASGDASIQGLEYGFRVLKSAATGCDSLREILRNLSVTHVLAQGEHETISELMRRGELELEYRKGNFSIYRVKDLKC